MGPLLKPGYSTVLLSYCRSRSMSLCACKWNKQKSLLRQKYLTKMLLGYAVMLFHRKMRHYKKYRALTDTDPLVFSIICITYKNICKTKYLPNWAHMPSLL